MFISARLCAAAVLAVVSSAVSAERPVFDFTDRGAMEWAKLSPDGTRLIARMKVDGESKLVIMPLDGKGASRPIGLPDDADLGRVNWVGNDWLVAQVGVQGRFQGYETYISRVAAFKADGSQMRLLEPTGGLADSGGTIRWIAEDGKPEWGRKMQDAVDDALAWAGAQGFADPKRACIVGGSYGGYVAMRAAQRNPDLYRCAISFAGVADLPAMMRQDQQSYFSGNYLRDYWKGQASDLEAVSPKNFAKDFGIPVLLVHGKKDQRIPVKESREMYAALLKSGKTAEYVEQPLGDHHFSRDEHMESFLLEAEKFLDRYNPA